MTLIRTQDVIQSVAEALQYISYYHPADFVRAVSEAYEMEICSRKRRYGADSHQLSTVR